MSDATTSAPAAPLRAVLIAVVVTLALAAALAYLGAATRQCPHGLRTAIERYQQAQRGVRGEERIAMAEFRCGDILFLQFDGAMAKAGAPLPVRQVKNQVSTHVALVLKHPRYGAVMVDACFDPRVRAGELVPLNSFSRAAPNLLRADGRVLNGGFRACAIHAAVAALKGCMWVRHVRPDASVDEDSMWSTMLRLNAAVPRLTQGNTNLENAAASALMGRAASWVARCLGEGLQGATDGWIGEGGRRHVSCIHSVISLLEAGGLWGRVPHRFDFPSSRQMDSALYTRNLAAGREVAVGKDAVEALGFAIAPIHALPVDLSSSSRVEAARTLWGEEVYLPNAQCRVHEF